MKSLTPYVVLAVILAAPLASADPAVDPPPTPLEKPAHSEHGLYLAITSGVASAATAAKLTDGTNVSLHGWGGTFELQIGASVTDNFVLAADMSSTSVLSPTFEQADMTVHSNDEVRWATAFIGATTAYYVMPLDLRLAGGLGVFRQALDVPNMSIARSDFGGAAKASLGKEWWVSEKWGIGLNLDSVLGVVPDDSVKDKGWGFFSLDLAVSATYR